MKGVSVYVEYDFSMEIMIYSEITFMSWRLRLILICLTKHEH